MHKMPPQQSLLNSLNDDVRLVFQQYHDYDLRGDLAWYEAAAYDAFFKGHFITIMDRANNEPYLSRFWLSPPQLRGDDGKNWESSNSVLLHYFHKGDDDSALHNHPWPFTTRILAGGYVEVRPPTDWQHGNHLGPDAEACCAYDRRPGDITNMNADTPHRVTNVLRGTWTLVSTGHQYEHEWSFFPAGCPPISWREFLHISE